MAVAGSQLIILATNIKLIMHYLEELGKEITADIIITDVGSTKYDICQKALTCLPPCATFIGGHPMTGSHLSGFQHANLSYFENSTYILTPPKHCNPVYLKALTNLVHKIGALPVHLSPSIHDIVVANISHLPQLISIALLNDIAILDKENPYIFKLAGGGLKDMTRIAASDYQMWQDIFATNHTAIKEAIDYFISYLDRLKTQLPGQPLAVEFNLANDSRKRLMESKVGYVKPIYDVQVNIADTIGVIADITQSLKTHQLDLKQIQILTIRDGDNGVLQLGFKTNRTAQNAAQLLQKQGFDVWMKD